MVEVRTAAGVEVVEVLVDLAGQSVLSGLQEVMVLVEVTKVVESAMTADAKSAMATMENCILTDLWGYLKR